MQVTLVNDDPFANHLLVIDNNDSNAELFNGQVPGNEQEGQNEVPITCRENDAGFGNITTYVDGHAPTGRSYLRGGERLSIF